LRVGTCGWSLARERYLARFSAIEVQQTFYQPPAVATARRWAQGVREGFAFSVKAWQLITHPATSPTYRRLRMPLDEQARGRCGNFADSPEVEMAFHRTMEVAEALQARAVLFQTPASFTPEPGHMERLVRFFRRHGPGGRLFCWEPRGSWPRELAEELCHELGLVLVADPFSGPVPQGPVVYLRLHGRGGYRYRYSEGELDQLAGWIRGWLAEGREVWCLFNNVWMAQDAARLQERLGQQGPPAREA
ncbi:MAG TPA: DUF72 domain-containing protein, partial [Limnochordales bacterium]